MARVSDLRPYCVKHGLKMITIADLVAYQRPNDRLVEREVFDEPADLIRGVRDRRILIIGRR